MAGKVTELRLGYGGEFSGVSFWLWIVVAYAAPLRERASRTRFSTGRQSPDSAAITHSAVTSPRPRPTPRSFLTRQAQAALRLQLQLRTLPVATVEEQTRDSSWFGPEQTERTGQATGGGGGCIQLQCRE